MRIPTNERPHIDISPKIVECEDVDRKTFNPEVPPVQEADVVHEKQSRKDSAIGNCCHSKWGKSSLLVRCLANPKRFHCGAHDRKPYLGKTHRKGLLTKILDKIDRMDTRLNNIHNVVRSIHAKHSKGSNGVLDEESGIILSEH